MSQMGPEAVRKYWQEQAQRYGQDPAASWSDRAAVDLEIRTIANYLDDGDRILDVGCANGYSTTQFAARKRLWIRGIDYVPAMIEHAQAGAAALREDLRGHVEFAVGDVLHLAESDDSYDKVVIVRVIINLGEWSTQLVGIRECARVLRQGGTLLMSEATIQGWHRLNAFRQEWGLADIPMPAFNNYIDEDLVARETADWLQLVEVSNFSSTYFVGTRILKPLLSQALGGRVDPTDPGTEWNRWFGTLPAWGDYGTQKLFVFRKR